MKKILLPGLAVLLAVCAYKYVHFDLREITPVLIQPAATFLRLSPEASPQERASAFLQPGCNSPLAVVHEWLPYYHRHPDPGNITEAFKVIAAAGRISNAGPTEKKDSPILSTFRSRVDQATPLLRKYLPEFLHPYLPPAHHIILDASENRAVIHFFAAVLHDQIKEFNEFKSAAPTYSGPWKTMALDVIAEAESYAPVELHSKEDINPLWAEYMATGDLSIVKRLTDGEAFNEKRKNAPEFVRAIEASLFNHSRLFVNVYDLVQEGAGEGEGFRNKRLKEIEKALKDYVVDRSRTHLKRGINHMNMKEFGKALVEYHKAHAYFPDYADIYLNMASSYEHLEEMDKAVAANQKAYQVQPTNAEVCYGLGRYFYLQKKYDQAMQMYLKATEIAPGNDTYIYAIASAYKSMGDQANAIKYYHQYLKKSPHGLHPEWIRKYLAGVNAPFVDDPDDLITLLKKHEYGKLEEKFSRLLSEKKKDRDGNSLLGNAYEYLTDYDDAKYAYDQWLKYFEDWRETMPSSHFANAAIGMFYITYAWHARGTGYAITITREGGEAFRERLELAGKYLEKAYELDRSDPVVPASLIRVAMALSLGDEEVEKQFRRALQADPQEYAAYSAKFLCLTPRWGGSREAMFDFARESARNAPAKSLIPRLLSMAHWEMYSIAEDRPAYFKRSGVWDELKPVYTRLCSQFPESMVLHNWFARTAYLAGDFATARVRFALIQDKWNASVWGNYKYFSRIRDEVQGKEKEDA